MSKDELTPENIIGKLPEILSIHYQNVTEIEYLDNYYKGIQPILDKIKVVRPEINNKILVNHAYEIVEFKKSYVFGDPVQYVQKGEKNTEETNPAISLLNKYMESEGKASKDKELAEWWYKIGTAYRWADIDKPEDEDEAPFEISIPDPKKTFVVYSTGIKEEQLFAGYIQNFTQLITTQDTQQIGEYQEYTIYLEDKVMVLTNQFGKLELKQLYGKGLLGRKKKLPNPYPLLIKGFRILEYPLNKNRIGLIELVISQLNAINRITSNELDDIEQFVQSLLVYVNQQVDIETHKRLIKLGAMEVFTSEPNKPADVKLLSQKMDNAKTKTYKDSIYDDVLTIVGIPRLNDKPSGGDTGQARLLGEGWTMADELKGLKLSDIDIKFTRNKSDNILVKTQALMNLMNAQCPPDIAFSVIGLFNDPNEVFEKAKQYYGDDLWRKAVSNVINGNNKNVGTIDNEDKSKKKENQSIKNISANEG